MTIKRHLCSMCEERYNISVGAAVDISFTHRSDLTAVSSVWRRACISQGRRSRTDTGFARCRRSEIRTQNTHTRSFSPSLKASFTDRSGQVWVGSAWCCCLLAAERSRVMWSHRRLRWERDLLVLDQSISLPVTLLAPFTTYGVAFYPILDYATEKIRTADRAWSVGKVMTFVQRAEKVYTGTYIPRTW